MVKKISNRTSYTLITLIIIVAVVAYIYALSSFNVSLAPSPGNPGDPGHNIQDVGAPSGCIAGQFVKWDGSNLVCSDPSG